MPRVRGPDGVVIEFPDDTPMETIKAAMQKRYGGAGGRGKSTLFDKADAVVRGAADTLSLGTADEISAGVYAPIGATVDAIKGRGFDLGRAYDRALSRERATDAYDARNAPVARSVGQVAGAVALPGGALASSGKLGTRLAVNAAQGGAYGFGSGEGGIENRALSAGKGALAAMAGGEVGRVAVKGGAAALRGANVAPAIKRLSDAGVRTTIGQKLGGRANNLEDRLSGFPVVGGPVREYRRGAFGDVMRAAGNDALGEIGQTISPASISGREIAAEVSDKAGDAYDAALRRMNVVADPQMATAIGQARQRPAVAELIDDEVIPRLGPNGELDGAAIQEIKEILDAEARRFLNAPGLRRDGKAVKAVRDAILDAADRQAPAAASDYRAARAAYGKAKTVSRASAKSTTDGIPTPRQLGMAIREGANRFGPKDAYGKGLAPMQQLADDAASVLPSSIPDPGTAGQLAVMDLVKNPLKSIPAVTGSAAVGALYNAPSQAVLEAILFRRPDVARKLGLLGSQLATPYGSALGLLAAGQVPTP